MEEREVSTLVKGIISIVLMVVVATVFFILGVWYSGDAHAAEEKKPRIVYPKHTEFDFEGMRLSGELRNPGEFYFKTKPEEKFDSLVKRRKHFHKEMLRDAVMSR